MMRTLIAALCLAGATPALAQDVTVVAGGGVSSGEYGSERDTTLGSASVGVRLTSGRTTVTASIPYVFIDSPGVVFSGFDGTPLVMLPDAGGSRISSDGIGDPTLSVSHDVPVGRVNMRGTARFKIPVQGLNRISTGQLDWSVGVEASMPMGGVTPFASVSYRGYGDPTGWTIRDGFAGSVGVSSQVGPGALAVSYDVARSTSRFVDDAHEILAAYDMPVSDRGMRLAAYGTVGLSDGAPGLEAGLRLTMPLR